MSAEETPGEGSLVMVADGILKEARELLSPTAGGRGELLGGEALCISEWTRLRISGMREDNKIATRELVSGGEMAAETDEVPAGTLSSSGEEIGTEKDVLFTVSVS